MKSKIARVLSCIFPAYAVKRKTLIANPNAKDWVIKDVAKALHLIKKLKLSEKEIAERVWLPSVRMELLSKGDPSVRRALASTVKSDSELMAVLTYGNVEDKVAAVRSFTPSAKRMRSLLSSPKTCVDFLREMAKEAPTAFNTLTVREILDMTTWQKCNQVKDWRWDLAFCLMSASPEWCPKFMALIKEISPMQLAERDIRNFKKIFAIAIKAKVSLAGFLSYMSVFFKEEYVQYVNAFAKYSKFDAEFEEMFPQYVKYLKDGANYYYSLTMLDTHIGENTSSEDVAYAWLGIGRDLVHRSSNIFNVFLNNIENIYAGNSNVGKELVDKMTECAHSIEDLERLQQKMGDVIDKDKFNERAYSIILAKSKFYGYADAPNYLKFFPFTDWKVENAKHAVRRIVLCNKLPVDRLEELSEELQLYVLQTMEAQSQLGALNAGRVDKLVKLQLYPEVEIELFCKKYQSCKEQILSYIDSFGMSQEAYEAIIRRDDVRESFVDYLTEYAEKYGLTQRQYVQLMQSRGSGLAPFLKMYVVNEPETKE